VVLGGKGFMGGSGSSPAKRRRWGRNHLLKYTAGQPSPFMVEKILAFVLLVVQSCGLSKDGILLLSFKYSVLSDPLAPISQGWFSKKKTKKEKNKNKNKIEATWLISELRSLLRDLGRKPAPNEPERIRIQSFERLKAPFSNSLPSPSPYFHFFQKTSNSKHSLLFNFLYHINNFLLLFK
jgi:hypothetical protein